MEGDVDTSILNSVNIKRFTKSVLEEYGAEVDTSNRAKWEVTFPDPLAERIDRETGTLVFDPADRELGSGDLLIQPGTQVFSALLELVEQSGSVGRLELTEDDLQVNPPEVLEESALAVELHEFRERTWDDALAFHFQVQFETPSSFHSEEMYTVTVDPATRSRLPDLSARLTAHLPQLLQQQNEAAPSDVSDEAVQASFEEAQQAVIDRARPVIAEIRDDAESSADERIAEIRDWYAQRREELDEELQEQKEEIRKWKKKYRNARKDSTRRRYVKNRKEAESEYERLQDEIAEKKSELTSEETEEIDAVLDRNEVDVAVSLLGVTEISYVRGSFDVEVSSGHAETEIELSYLPATDEFQGLECAVCSQDLTAGVLPQVCANGHLVGDPCATSCRECAYAYCDDCGGTKQFVDCEVCWDSVCRSCAVTCTSCESPVCPDHAEDCGSCDGSTCHLCGEPCSTCEEFYCDDDLRQCPTCESLHCSSHMESCSKCDAIRCTADMRACQECGDRVCDEHAVSCDTCNDTLCPDDVDFCGVCSTETEHERNGYCHEHTIQCGVGGTVICSDHRSPRKIASGYVCADHQAACSTCKVRYSTDELVDGHCSACRGFGDFDESEIPAEIANEFRSVTAGGNKAFLVVLGKQLLGRNKLIVYDREAREEYSRHNAGLLKQLTGGYK